MSARLPKPGQDEGTWGSILNDFLAVGHNIDGTLKTIQEDTLSPELQTKINTISDVSGKLDVSQKGVAGGIAALSAEGSVLDQALNPLPSIFDLSPEVLVYNTKTAKRIAPTLELDNTGTTNQIDLIQAFIAAAPNGATITFPPGTYRIHGDMINQNSDGSPKSIHLKGYGATIIRTNASGGAIKLQGGYESTYSVGTVTASTKYTESLKEGIHAPMQTVVFTVPASDALNWKRGDIVKLFADDAQPDNRNNSFNPSPNSQGADQLNRVGQFLSIHSVANDTVGVTKTVTAFGVLRDSFTVNVRVAKLLPITASVEGFTLMTSDGIMATSTDQSGGQNLLNNAANMVVVESMMHPIVRNVTTLQNNGPGISMGDNFGYTVEGCQIQYNLNDGGPHFGYGVIDNSSYAGTIRGNVIRESRHAVTTGGYLAVANTSVRRYGRSVGLTVIDNVAENTTSSAYDTHLGAMHVTFSNNIAIGSRGGFSLRGIGHIVNGGLVRDCDDGLSINNERSNNALGSGRRSYKHTVMNLTVINATRGISVNHNLQAENNGSYSNPPDHVRFPGFTYFKNITLIGLKGTAIELNNTTIQMDTVSVHFGRNVDTSKDTAIGIVLANSFLYGSGFTFDTRGEVVEVADGSNPTIPTLTTPIFDGPAPRLFSLGTIPEHASLLELTGTTRLHNASNTQFKSLMQHPENATARIEHLILNHAWDSGTSPHPYDTNTLTNDSWFDYEVINSPSVNSAWVSVANASIIDAFYSTRLTYSKEATLGLELTPADGSRVLPAIPRAKRTGQRVLIRNNAANGAGSITLKHGDDGNLSNASGNDLTLAPGKTVEYLYSNGAARWCQISAVL